MRKLKTNPARERFLVQCAAIKAKMEELRIIEARQKFYRPDVLPAVAVKQIPQDPIVFRRKVDPFQELLGYYHDLQAVIREDRTLSMMTVERLSGPALQFQVFARGHVRI